MHPVLELMRARRRRGDEPGDRGDDRRLVLAVEGGGSRATFSAGMVAALAENGLSRVFDAVYGASAGALNGAWFVAGATDLGIPAWYRPGVMTRVTGIARMLRGRPLVDMRWVVDELYEHVVPMDWEAVRTGAVPLHPLATDTVTGATTDLRPLVTDAASLRTALRASTHLPVLGGAPVALAGRSFVDAALAETLPFRTPLAQGATDVLLLRTRRADDPVRPPWRSGDALARAVLSRGAPGAAAAWRTRYDRLLADEAWLTGPGRAVVCAIRPRSGALAIGQRETRVGLLHSAVEAGRRAVLDRLGEPVS